ncbi:MAG: PAS domain S-box protein, partial [Anaerolineae bacterium]|nr:PAS domain S-box protein [Anaerolineae bacterium]
MAREAVINGMDDGVIVLDVQHRIVDLNPKAETLFDQPGLLGQLIGQVWPDWPAVLAEAQAQGGRGGEMILDRAGDHHIYDVRISSLYDWRERLMSRVVVLRNITDRKQIESRYRVLFEGAPIMYVITVATAEGPVISDCNQLFLQTLGYDRTEVLNRPLSDFYTPVSRFQLMEGGGYQDALKGQFVIQERQLMARDGRVIETILQALPELDPIVGRSYGTRAMFVDVTDRKQAEAALRENEELLRATFEQAAMGIAHVALDGRWLRVNQRLCDIVGYSAEALGTLTFQQITHPADLDSNLGLLEQLIAGDIQNYSIEKRYIHQNGSPVWVQVTTSLVRDGAGQPKYFIAVIEDIAERKHGEKMVQKYAGELERSNRELEQFAYIASHDLKEPLRKIQTFGGRLEAKYGEALGEQGRDYLSRMNNATVRMQALIDGLLAFSRITTQAQPFALVNLAEVLSEVLDDLAARLEQSGGQVVVGDLPSLEADPVQMR